MAVYLYTFRFDSNQLPILRLDGLEVFPDLALALGVAQEVGRVKGGHHQDAENLVESSPQGADGRIGL